MTTLARGVSVGDELEYTDEITLGRSILNRILFEVKSEKIEHDQTKTDRPLTISSHTLS